MKPFAGEIQWRDDDGFRYRVVTGLIERHEEKHVVRLDPISLGVVGGLVSWRGTFILPPGGPAIEPGSLWTLLVSGGPDFDFMAERVTPGYGDAVLVGFQGYGKPLRDCPPE